MNDEELTKQADSVPPRRMTLREMRGASGKGQVDVAAKTGFTQSMISRFEREGDNKISNLRLYAQAIGYADVEVVFVGKDGTRVTMQEPKKTA